MKKAEEILDSIKEYVKLVEIDPSKKCILMVDINSVPEHEIYIFNEKLKEFGIKDTLILATPDMKIDFKELDQFYRYAIFRELAETDPDFIDLILSEQKPITDKPI